MADVSIGESVAAKTVRVAGMNDAEVDRVLLAGATLLEDLDFEMVDESGARTTSGELVLPNAKSPDGSGGGYRNGRTVAATGC